MLLFCRPWRRTSCILNVFLCVFRHESAVKQHQSQEQFPSGRSLRVESAQALSQSLAKNTSEKPSTVIAAISSPPERHGRDFATWDPKLSHPAVLHQSEAPPLHQCQRQAIGSARGAGQWVSDGPPAPTTATSKKKMIRKEKKRKEDKRRLV